MTNNQLERLKKMFSMIMENDQFTMEVINDNVYVYSNALNCYKLYYGYRHTPDKAKVSYSTNLETHYFVLYLDKYDQL